MIKFYEKIIPFYNYRGGGGGGIIALPFIKGRLNRKTIGGNA